MRTLKKSLCLVLAVVFVLGLCTIGTNAVYAQYTDMETVTYEEAVEVLSGLLVIDGYPDDTFQPTANVTRAEAAAMICRMMLGREAADKLPIGEVKFTDVPESNWAAKYIAFCANKGIIVGMGDGTFRPSDNVTGTQMATMLLRALGYGVIGEYEGKGWDINAVADALYYGVFKDSKATDFNQAATREETALYIWNTLWLQLVGYDVDLNYYNGKYHIEDDRAWFIPTTFASESFNLREIGYGSDSMRGTYVVVGNQATGYKYTMIAEYIDFETTASGQTFRWGDVIYLDYETPLDLIGHEVTVYIDRNEIEDKKEHVDYFKTYLIKDESTVLAKGSKLDDFYRAAKEANKNNLEKWFDEVAVIYNYDYTRISNFADPFGYVMDYDDYYAYYQIKEVKGQKSSKDYAPSGTWILDHAGEVLLVRKTDYKVAKVKAVDKDHEEVELDVYKEDTTFFPDGAYDMKWNDIDLIQYEGIAKGDYVTVEPAGKLYYIYPTTTATDDILEVGMYFIGFNTDKEGKPILDEPQYSLSFNYYKYTQGTGYGINIVDQDWSEDVGVGDKVLFYLTRFGTFFGLQIVEKAKTEGIVYVTLVDKFLDHGDWYKKTDDSTWNEVWKVQCVNQEGEEVVYKFTEKQLADGKVVTGGVAGVKPDEDAVYEVRKQGNTLFFDNKLKNVVQTKSSGKSTYLRSATDTYFVTSDTKVIYFTGTGPDLEIEVANRLNKTSGYDVYAVTKRSGGNYKLESVFIKDQAAPENYLTDTYMYVVNQKDGFTPIGGSMPSGKELFNDVPQLYYYFYVDGAMKKMYVTSEYVDVIESNDMVNYGFYLYVDSNSDGIYELKPAGEAVTANHNVFRNELGQITGGYRKNVKIGPGYGSIDSEGRFYAAGSEYVELKVIFVDVSGDTTSGTKTDASVIDPERLQELIDEKYTITVDYLYVLDADGNEVPIGAMYVTNVTTPDGERGSIN